MNKTEKQIGLLVAIIVSVAAVALSFPDMVFSPSHCFISVNGDGGKNLFTFLYHVLYGKALHFTGMNYPYGEHIVFTDGQPLLSVALGYVPGINAKQATGVMWLAIASGFVLSIVFLYRTLVHFRVVQPLALLFAVLIGLLSPQVLRFDGHYGLSYMFVVPMLFYFTVQYHATSRRMYALYILMLGICAVFLHPYFSALVFIWVALYVVGYVLFYRKTIKQYVVHLLPIVLAAGFLLGGFGVFMGLTDTLTDRPVAPYGMLVYCTTGPEILTSSYSPIWQAFQRNVVNIGAVNGGEGYCYPGIVPIVTVVLAVIAAVRARKKKVIVPDVTNHSFEGMWLFVAFGALLFSMGVPFVWHMDWLLKYLSFFRQFRTLGRFSWIFYYVIAVYAAVYISAFAQRKVQEGKKRAAAVVLLLAVSIWSTETVGFVIAKQEIFKRKKENEIIITGQYNHSWEDFLRLHNYSTDDFQASLVLSFIEIGTDKLWLGNDIVGRAIKGVVLTGLQLRLPTIDAMMSRSSWSQIQNQVKLMGGPFVHKPILDDLPNNKPILLLNMEDDSLNVDEQYLLEASDYLGNFHEWRVFACYPERIRQNDSLLNDSVQKILPVLPVGDNAIGEGGTFYVNHYDDMPNATALYSKGAKKAIPEAVINVQEIIVKDTVAGRMYEFSCWFLLDKNTYQSPYYLLELLDVSGNLLRTETILTKESTDSRGMWFRAGGYFRMPANCVTVRCMLHSDTPDAYLLMDELMLRPAAGLYLNKQADGGCMVNNHLIDKKMKMLQQ